MKNLFVLSNVSHIIINRLNVLKLRNFSYLKLCKYWCLFIKNLKKYTLLCSHFTLRAQQQYQLFPVWGYVLTGLVLGQEEPVLKSIHHPLHQLTNPYEKKERTLANQAIRDILSHKKCKSAPILKNFSLFILIRTVLRLKGSQL